MDGNIEKAMRLAAMESPQTVSAELTNYFLPEEKVVFVKGPAWAKRNDMINIVLQGHFALGCAQAGIDVVREAFERKSLHFILEAAEELESVATCYNLIFRRAVGRHVILICDSVACWIMGYESVGNFLSGRLGIGLGETTPDGIFTLLPTVCLGACDQAPVMMIDDELYGNLTPEKVEEVLKKYK